MMVKNNRKKHILSQMRAKGSALSQGSHSNTSVYSKNNRESRKYIVGGRGMNGSPWRRQSSSLRHLYIQAKQCALAQTTRERGELPEPEDENRNRWHARNSKVSKKVYIPLLENGFINLEKSIRLKEAELNRIDEKTQILSSEKDSLLESLRSAFQSATTIIRAFKAEKLSYREPNFTKQTLCKHIENNQINEVGQQVDRVFNEYEMKSTLMTTNEPEMSKLNDDVLQITPELTQNSSTCDGKKFNATADNDELKENDYTVFQKRYENLDYEENFVQENRNLEVLSSIPQLPLKNISNDKEFFDEVDIFLSEQSVYVKENPCPE